jgi:hypothetical protein
MEESNKAIGKLFRANLKLGLYKEDGEHGSGGAIEKDDYFLVVKYQENFKSMPAYLALSHKNFGWIVLFKDTRLWIVASEVQA